MNARTLRTLKPATALGAIALAVAACGSSNASTSGGSTGASSAGRAIVAMASVDGTSTLATSDGHTLYDASGETPDHILCVGACTHFWKPLMASGQQAEQASSTLAETFSAVSRPDGGTQLALAGHPLYTFTQEGAHQLRGNGFKDEFQGTSFQWSAATTGGKVSMPPSTGSTGTGSGGYGY
ncbi:hypothetical protein [Nocardioides sp. CER19]|uniref:hypothetical protein n=1 Tax=Nocardioides sp. CER19 TaxID=3038538 RepID=UPI00244C0B1A|nr:hypothetical protein [Nocardioides sp. CER19]MDH2416469.1 hypothetical protein [Nocardioides sp. CER19]